MCFVKQYSKKEILLWFAILVIVLFLACILPSVFLPTAVIFILAPVLDCMSEDARTESRFKIFRLLYESCLFFLVLQLVAGGTGVYEKVNSVLTSLIITVISIPLAWLDVRKTHRSTLSILDVKALLVDGKLAEAVLMCDSILSRGPFKDEEDTLVGMLVDMSMLECAGSTSGKRFYEQKDYPLTYKNLCFLVDKYSRCKNVGRLQALAEQVLGHYIAEMGPETEVSDIIRSVGRENSSLVKQKLVDIITSAWDDEEKALPEVRRFLSLYVDDEDTHAILRSYYWILNNYPDIRIMQEICDRTAKVLEKDFEDAIESEIRDNSNDYDDYYYLLDDSDEFHLDSVPVADAHGDEEQAFLDLSKYNGSIFHKMRLDSQVEIVEQFRSYFHTYKQGQHRLDISKLYINMLSDF